jgi:SAM-dependent methyltransferase
LTIHDENNEMNRKTAPTANILVYEPLSASAPMSHKWAGLYCGPHFCQSYHRFWQYLRLMGLGSTLGGHPGAYLEAFTSLQTLWQNQKPGKRRILIAGAADYSMLAHLWQVFQLYPGSLEISVLDRCQTPLKLNQWYAEPRGISIRLLESDILLLEEEEYDLIVTSSFLGNFDPDARFELFNRINRLLRKDGQFISSNRLRPQPENQRLPIEEERIEQFIGLVEKRGRTLAEFSALPLSELRQAAMDYIMDRRPFPVNSLASIENIALASGLTLISAFYLQNCQSATGLNIPTLNDSSQYVFFHLTRA